MKKLIAALVLSLVSSVALAAQPKTYQVTGKVLDANEDMITVEKGKEKFEIARGEVKDEVKPGDKVTIQYRMTAASLEKKAEAAKGEKKGADKAEKKAAEPKK